MRTLSKSDFKLGRTCATKIYYKEHHYPQRTDDDPFLRFLAEGGYMVERLARMLYPEGITLQYGRDPEQDRSETAALLERDAVTLFEATLLHGAELARVDILRKRGNRFELIEVKSKSFRGGSADDGDGPGAAFDSFVGRRGRVKAEWQPYLEDVAFQVALLRKVFPAAEIAPYLLIVNKAAECSVDRLPAQFLIERDVARAGGRHDLEVTFIGDPAAIDAGEFLTCCDVSAEVAQLIGDVELAGAELVALYHGNAVERAAPRLTVACGKCEFRIADGRVPNGFLECWGEHGRHQHHLLDLWHVGHLQGKPFVQRLIDEHRVALHHVPLDQLGAPRADGSGWAHRQRKQVEHAATGTPYLDERLLEQLESFRWPVHFVDFETLAMAIPPFRRMRPYELVGFQWSCHSVPGPDAAPVHHEWLADGEAWPHRRFLETLREAIGDAGTVLTWSSHEETTLRAILGQDRRCGTLGAPLAEWTAALLADANAGGRIVDLERSCRRFYLHPLARGRTSIKPLLDAIWQSEPSVARWYREWATRPVPVADGQGPYESLATVEVDGVTLDVHEGTGAANAYRRMLFDPSLSPAMRATLRELLLRYCELDTLAMVLVWRCWRESGAGNA